MNLLSIDLQSFGSYRKFFNETDVKMLAMEVEDVKGDFEAFKAELEKQVVSFIIKAHKENGVFADVHIDGNVRINGEKFTLNRIIYSTHTLEVRPYNKFEDCFPEHTKYDVVDVDIIQVMEKIMKHLLGDIMEILEV